MKTRIGLLALILLLSSALSAQDGSIRGSVRVLHQSRNQIGDVGAVVWLTSVRTKEAVSPGPTARLLQKDKRFEPHVLAVTVGTAIEFPNKDPFFHNVFSIYHGKPFDLGLYESGTVRKVHFTQLGVSYIFCNIHPDMSAAVVVLNTPHFAVTTRDGSFHIDNIPPGRYRLEIWHELAAAPELKSLSREIEITASDNRLANMTLHALETPEEHLNKYGEPYPVDKGTKY